MPFKSFLDAVRQFLREVFCIIIKLPRRQQALNTPLYANSMYLMGNYAVSATLGFVFWVVVAKLYAAEVVGLGSALVSALAAGVGSVRTLTEELAAGVREKVPAT